MPGCQLHHPRLDHHSPRPEPADGIALPAAPVLRKGCHRLGAPAMRVESAASSFPATDPAGVAAGLGHGKFDLTGKGQIARIGARSGPSGTAWPDADIVAVVLCHDRTIGIRIMLPKSLQVPVVLWRNDTCSSVERRNRPRRAVRPPYSLTLKTKGKRLRHHPAHLPQCRFGTPAHCRNQCANKHLRPKGRRITNRLYLAFNRISAPGAFSTKIANSASASARSGKFLR